MSLESGTYISDLVVTNPTGTDPKSQGDDHLRLLKSTIKTTFPNISGAVTPTHTELNYVDGVTSAIQTQLDAKIGTTLASARIIVGNGSNVATAVDVTGDVTISNAGVTAIGSGVIVNADVNASAGIALSKLASGTAYYLLANNGSGVPTERAPVVSANSGSLAGLATYDFTALPSWIRQITICFSGLDITEASRRPAVRLGYGSTTWVSTGYAGSMSTSALSGEILLAPVSAQVWSGTLTLTKMHNNYWAFSGYTGTHAGADTYLVAGSVDVTDVLTGVQILLATNDGDDTYSAGNVTINYI